MRDAYIVTSIRTPGCKRGKGAFSDTRPEDLLSFILSTAVERTPNLQKKDVEDIMVGCCFPEAEQGLNIGRLVSQIAGFPAEVTGATVNRFCASGLEAITAAALKVMAGWADVVVGGGVESMTYIPMGGFMPRPHPEYTREHAGLYVSMGITAENVARRYKISREDQDDFAFQSQTRAANARKNTLFSELVPTPATKFVRQQDGTYEKESIVQAFDDGIRDNTTREGLAALQPVFAAGGTVTAGNSSQTTDGAAAAIIMSEKKVKDFGVRPHPEILDLLFAHDNRRRRTVGGLGRIAGRHRAAGRKNRLQRRQSFAGRVIPDAVIEGLDNRFFFVSTVLLPDEFCGRRRHQLGEKGVFPGVGGSSLRLKCKVVLVFARDFVASGDILGRDAHRHVKSGMFTGILGMRPGHEPAHRDIGHRLYPAADDDIRPARHYFQGRGGDRFQT